MKRILSFLLLISLMTGLAGCGSKMEDAVAFYYYRDAEQYQYFEEDGVIQSESRELAAHRTDLRYMLGLYLAGPIQEGLQNPYPAGTQLLSVEKNGNTVQIQLSELDESFSDSQFTLSCACMTLTCMGFTPCQEVTVVSGERTITLNRDSIIMFDNTAPAEEPTEEPS